MPGRRGQTTGLPGRAGDGLTGAVLPCPTAHSSLGRVSPGYPHVFLPWTGGPWAGGPHVQVRWPGPRPGRGTGPCLPPGVWFYDFFVALVCRLLFTYECQSLVTAEGTREDIPTAASSPPNRPVEGLCLIHGILGPLGSRWAWEAPGPPQPTPSTWGCPVWDKARPGTGRVADSLTLWCVSSARRGAVQLAHLSESKNRLPPRAVKPWAERVRTGGAPGARGEVPPGACSGRTPLLQASRPAGFHV